MSAHEILEGFVRTGHNNHSEELMPYHLDDVDEVICLLDEDCQDRPLGRDTFSREVNGNLFGTYIH